MIKRIAPLIFAVTSALFVFKITLPGKLSFWGSFPFLEDGTWRSVTVDALSFLTNSLNAKSLLGVISLDFQVPNSVAGPQIYFSYPQGFLFFPYLYFKIRGAIPTLESLYIYSLFNQALVGFLISATVFFAVKDLCGKIWSAIFLALAAQATFFFLPPIYFWYGNTWWPDTAALTSVGLLLFWSVFQDKVTNPKIRNGTEFFVLLLNGCTDWFSLLVALSYVGLKFERTKRRENLRRIGAVAAGLFFYAIPILTNKAGIKAIASVFLKRTNLTANEIDGRIHSFSQFWQLLSWQMTPWPVLFYAIFLLFTLGAGIYFLKSNKNPRYRKIATIAFLITIPAILHLGILAEHYANHPFEILKFALAASILVPAFLPAVFLARFSQWKIRYLACAVPLIFLYALVGQFPQLHDLESGTTFNVPAGYTKLCESINRMPEGKLFFLPVDPRRELIYVVSYFCRRNQIELTDDSDPRQLFRRVRHFHSAEALIWPKNKKLASRWLKYLDRKKKLSVGDWDIFPVVWPQEWTSAFQ